MSVKLQILKTFGSVTPTTFTANGTVACLGDETVTVKVVLVPPDLGSTPAVQAATLTPVTGAAGFSEWSATFGSSIPAVPFALYALAYNSSTSGLVAEASETIQIIPSTKAAKKHKGSPKKKVGKVGKKK